MRIAIAKSAAVFRHKQLNYSYASLDACVSSPPGPILVDQYWSEWSGVHVAN